MQKVAILTIIKLFSFKEGSLFVGSSFISFSSLITLISFERLNSEFELQKIVLSFFIWIGFTFIFSCFSFGDLITGIQAVLYENKESENPKPFKEVVKSKKMWATIWKGFAVFMITGMLCFASMISVFLKSDIFYYVTIYMLITFSIMACGFEFYSIGENTAKLNNGKKKDIYVFFGKLLDIIEKRIIKRVENFDNNNPQ